MRLFDRTWSVSTEDVDISDLDMQFQITKSVKREPNTAILRVFNLAPATRSRLEGPRREDQSTVKIRAGYRDQGDPPPTLFVGEARRVYSEFDGEDIVTTIEARDGGIQYTAARLSRNYAPGTAVSVVLRDLVTQMGIGEGNLNEFEVAYALRNGASSFVDGYAVSGPIRRSLNAIVRGAGLRWSIQNGALQLQRRRTALQTSSVVISPDSGMLGSPTREKKGAVTVSTLIQPGLDPGRKFVVESRLVTGTYEVQRVEYAGDTAGNDWYARVSGKPVSS